MLEAEHLAGGLEGAGGGGVGAVNASVSDGIQV